VENSAELSTWASLRPVGPGTELEPNEQFLDFASAKKALPILKELLRRDEQNWQAAVNMAAIYRILGDCDKALAILQTCLKISDDLLVHLNLGMVYGDHGLFDQAFRHIEIAHLKNPNHRFAAFLYGEFLLREDRYREGWPIFLQNRPLKEISETFSKVIPEWTGQSLEGKKLLVLGEGGFGDTIMFLRYFGKLQNSKASRLTFAARDKMLGLLSGHPWIDELIGLEDLSRYPDVMSQYDLFVSMLSFPAIFGTEIETIPWWETPYLRGCVPPSAYVPSGPKLRVGLCWSAGETWEVKHYRCLDWKQARALRSMEGIDWVSLQYGENRSIKTWEDTARLIAGLDLVISVDTSVMHLAAAMGVKTWVILNSFSAWLFGRYEICPWYPFIRLFRNEGVNIQKALDSCTEELKKLV